MTFRVGKQDKSSSPLIIGDLSHKKVILYILLLTLFILPSYAGNFFNISEDFNNCNVRARGLNKSYNSIYYNMKSSLKNDTSFDCDNSIFLRSTSSTYQYVSNTSSIFRNGNSYSIWTNKSTGIYGNTDMIINFSSNYPECKNGNCYLSPSTRIWFNLSFENNAIAPAGAPIVFGFIKRRYNYTDVVTPIAEYTGVQSYANRFDINESMTGWLEYRSHSGGTSFLTCNYTRYHDSGLINFTMDELNDDSNPYCQVEYDEPIIAFVIDFWHEDGATIVNQSIDNFYIYNLFNGTNQLPYVNVTHTDQCINDSVNGQSTLNITSFDTEGDIIYYAVQKDGSYMVDKYLSFDKYDTTSTYQRLSNGILCRSFLSILGLCTNFERYGVSVSFPSLDDIDTQCSMMDNINYVDQFNRSIFYTFDINNGYKLSWNISKCGDKRLSIFNSDTKYNESLYSLSYMIQPNNGTVFTINPSYDNFFQSIHPILINRTGGKTYISFSTNRYNTTKQKIEIRHFINYDTNTYDISIFDQSSYFDSTPLYTKNKALLGDNYPYVSINGQQGFVYLDDIIFWRQNNSVSWSTSLPDILEYDSVGTYYNTLYVTDEIHLSTDYNEYPFTVQIDQCKYVGDSALNTEVYSECTSNIDVLCWINALIGKPFRYYYNELDPNGNAQTFVWWAYVILFFILFFTYYSISHNPDITLPLISSSLIIMFVSFIGGFTASLVGSIIGLSLVLMTVFARIFVGDSSDR